MADRDSGNPFFTALYLTGGLCTGAGIISLYWSFGWPGGPLNGDLRQVGFSGIDNIELLSLGDFSIPSVVVGICCLVLANALAWKETDGY